MQRDNGPPAGCASCRHQHKKCNESCVLAPYLTLDKNLEFQAVHKVFGVGNVAKIVKSLDAEDRGRAVESLVWEANCRQNDPVLGSYGEFMRLSEELDKYRTLYWNNIHAQGNMSMNMNANVSVAVLPANSYAGYGYPTMQSAGALRGEIGYPTMQSAGALRGEIGYPTMQSAGALRGEIGYDYPYVQGTDGFKEESNRSALSLPLQYGVQINENLKDGSNDGSVIVPQRYSTRGAVVASSDITIHELLLSSNEFTGSDHVDNSITASPQLQRIPNKDPARKMTRLFYTKSALTFDRDNSVGCSSASNNEFG
ncbi:hypothetical protein ACET3Z_022851 [Daucus carota]